MKNVLLIIIFAELGIAYGQKENKRALFVQWEYQFLKYNYMTVGLGYHPEKNLFSSVRKWQKYYFDGVTLNYNKKLENSDWGTSIQAIIYTGESTGLGWEVNYKSVNQTDHFCLKPIIGLSFAFASLVYAYNFDFYKIKAERVSQHELILGLRWAVLRKKE